MAGLTDEAIFALMNSGRTKGGYVTKLADFLGSGEKGVCANETWVDISGKKHATIKSGFESAKTRKDAPDGADKVLVRVQDEKVYLINLSLVQSAEADAE